MKASLRELLQIAIEQNASDLHIASAISPRIRVDSKLISLDQFPALSEEESKTLCTEMISPEQKEEFKRELELDFSFDMGKQARVRGNLFRKADTIGGAFRVIPYDIPDAVELGLPASIMNLTNKKNGLILVTGPTGSGKSTTLAAMINKINQSRFDHIVTIEDPIEYVYQAKNCLVSQREIGHDSRSFKEALRHVLRQDPDVVLIGEMRDLDTIQSAITVAETGHLVLATLHTNSAAQTIDRIIDVFPPHQQPQIRTQLSMILQGIISQQLIPKINGGRTLAMEVMIPNYAIRNLIRENKIPQLYSQMQMGQEGSNMQTLNQSLAELVNSKTITKEEAVSRCTDSDELIGLLKGTKDGS